MTNDDDLFADWTAPVVKPARKSRPVAPVVVQPAIGPVASYACVCGARDEVKEPAPDALDCWRCHDLDGLRRFVPVVPPPARGGRELTALERRGIELDASRSSRR